MSMIGGSATVSQTIEPDGSFTEVETLSGLAGAIYTNTKATNLAAYNELMAQMDAAIALPREHLSPAELAGVRTQLRASKAQASLAMKQGWAKQANELGPPIVAYLQANAELVTTNLRARVTTSTSVGRTPDPNDPNTSIQPPAADVDLAAVAVGGAVRIQ